jgi:hypothetical protein
MGKPEQFSFFSRNLLKQTRENGRVYHDIASTQTDNLNKVAFEKNSANSAKSRGVKNCVARGFDSVRCQMRATSLRQGRLFPRLRIQKHNWNL